MKPICLVVPVYGEPEVTNQMLADVMREEELVEVVLVDNKGDFDSPLPVTILKPGTNLGWLSGTNHGLFFGYQQGYSLFVCMNNDVRLSPGFFHGLLPVTQQPACGLFGPAYRGSFYHQRPSSQYQGEAALYTPAKVVRPVANIDGTCLCIPRTTLSMVGYLDPFFEPRGWGADHDYCIRVRQTHRKIYVTEEAYLYHLTHHTASHLDPGYVTKAYEAYGEKMRQKYGEGYLKEVWAV